MRAYPPEKRQAVLADVPELGISGAAQAHSIGKATVSRWAEEAGIGTVPNDRTRAATDAARLRWEERRVDLANDLGELAAESLAVIRTNLTDKPRTASDLARVLAVAIDKAQLLTGGQTSRHGVEGDREGVLHGARTDALRLVG